MNGQLQNDPFLEIVVSRQSKLHQTYVQNKILLTEKKAANHNVSFHFKTILSFKQCPH